jgi:hypothetical protein
LTIEEYIVTTNNCKVIIDYGTVSTASIAIRMLLLRSIVFITVVSVNEENNSPAVGAHLINHCLM